MQLTWNPALSIGNEEIDKQHIALFGFFGDFVDGCSRGEAKDKLLELHDRLKDYVEHHFQAEEALMQQVNFPDLIEHRRKHQSFRLRLSDIRQQISSQGPTLMNIIHTNKALVSWLVQHVQDLDQTFGEYLKEHPPGQA